MLELKRERSLTSTYDFYCQFVSTPGRYPVRVYSMHAIAVPSSRGLPSCLSLTSIEIIKFVFPKSTLQQVGLKSLCYAKKSVTLLCPEIDEKLHIQWTFKWRKRRGFSIRMKQACWGPSHESKLHSFRGRGSSQHSFRESSLKCLSRNINLAHDSTTF